MDLDELTKAAFSIIKDDDPYKASKQLQIKNCGSGYLERINTYSLPFFLDVLSDEECWKTVGGLHGVKLDRRTVAKKMIEPKSWKGMKNPLEDFLRYQIACWCCLEEDIRALFQHFKQEDEIKDDDSSALEKLVKSVSGNCYTDVMMQFWSHFVSGYISKLDLKGQHPCVFGLNRAAISSNRRRVEAVEFFWNKVKALPEDELSTQEKDEIFMKIAVHTAKDNGYPDVFEFCLSQISCDKYPELLKRDLEKNSYYASLYRTLEVFNFDKFQELFNCLKPSDISEHDYHLWLKCIKIQDCSECYIDEAVKLFTHIWIKEGFDSQRAFVINEKVIDKSDYFHSNMLIHWIKKGYMEPVWIVMDKLDSNQIKEFMTSKQADYICSVLKERDNDSLSKFLSYLTEEKNIPGPRGDLAEVKLWEMYNQLHLG